MYILIESSIAQPSLDENNQLVYSSTNQFYLHKKNQQMEATAYA